MYATIRRYEGVDESRLVEITKKANENLIPRLSELPGFSGCPSSSASNRFEPNVREGPLAGLLFGPALRAGASGRSSPSTAGSARSASSAATEDHPGDPAPTRLPPPASAGQQVDQREEGDDDHRSDGDDGDGGRGNDHAHLFPSGQRA
jgi:hypothetical protein